MTTLVRPSQFWDQTRELDLPHHQRQVDALADSIAEHGYREDWANKDRPITVGYHDDQPWISNGHRRLKALQQLDRDDPIPVDFRGHTRSAAWTPPPTRLPNGDHVGSYGDAGPGGQYNEVLGAHHGQTGEYSGHLAVNSLGGEHHVQFMETPEHLRGRGTMTGLVEHYRKHYMEPGDTLHWGMQTPEGAAWISKHAAWMDPGNKPAYEPHPPHIEDDDEAMSRHFERQRAIRDGWEGGVRRGLAMGHLTNEQAMERGYRGNGHDTNQHGEPNWSPLPHTLYHVTTDVPGVHRDGLRSRNELSQERGKGLGGGESDTISYTDDPKIARDIHHSMGEFHDVVTGKVGPHELMERARTGDMGSRPFEREMRDSNAMDIDRVLRGVQNHHGSPFTTQAEMDEQHGPGVYRPHPNDEGFNAPKGRVHSRWQRDSTPDEQREDNADLYKHFSHWRDHAGGHPDPLFFSTDTKGFAATDRAHHGIVKAHAKPGAQGYQLHALGEWRSPTGDNVTVDRDHDPHTASTYARRTPDKRVFGPTHGLDKRLWTAAGRLKSDVRVFLLRKVGHFLTQRYGPNWQRWARIYFAGSEASMWTSPDLIGNSDFDTLIGINYPEMRKAVPELAHASNARITDMLNDQLRHELRDPAESIKIDGKATGPWDATFYVNPDSWDIRKIKPYAAYNVGANEWAVEPPDLPDWGVDKMPPTVLKALRGAEAYARDVLRLPEPQRTQQGAALFDAWHSDRSRAFSERGQGWYDFANLREKWLDQQGVWAKLVQCRHDADQGKDMAPADWSNMPFFGKQRTALLDPNQVRHTDPEQFARDFHDTVHGTPHQHHVSFHSPQEIREHKMTPLSANGGKTGVLIHDHGDGRVEATGLYNRSETKGAGIDILKHAIDHHGVNYAECYGPRLPKLYSALGFKTHEQYPFDHELAHPHWDHEQFNSPDYHVMHLEGRKMAALDDLISEGRWGDPQWLAELRSRVEAELLAEHGPEWMAEHNQYGDADWQAALAQLGIS